MSKHTPGPWKVSKEETSGKRLVYIRIASMPGDVGTTGVYGHYEDGTTAGSAYVDRFGTKRYKPVISEEEARANAHLIAAAPEMLEALEKAIPWLRDHVAMTCSDMRGLDGDVRDRVALDLAEAAIRKAKGE